MSPFLSDFFISSWKGVVLVIALAFLIFTRESWNELLRETFRFSWRKKDMEVGMGRSQREREDENENLREEIARRDAEIALHEHTEEQLEEIIVLDTKIIEEYEFRYLDLYFVPATKRALRWFTDHGPATKGVFLKTFGLPPETEDPDAEREAIINALLVWGMVEEGERGLLDATPKGERFLETM